MNNDVRAALERLVRGINDPRRSSYDAMVAGLALVRQALEEAEQRAEQVQHVCTRCGYLAATHHGTQLTRLRALLATAASRGAVERCDHALATENNGLMYDWTSISV